jgi:hypothetical protein
MLAGAMAIWTAGLFATTHSKMMAWAAFDRAIRRVEEFAVPGRVGLARAAHRDP